MGAHTNECDLCGACCKTFPIYVSKEDAEREPRINNHALLLKPWLKTSDWEYKLHPLPFGESCAFLDCANLCTIYQTRPDVCRRFEAGSAQCDEARERIGLPKLSSINNPMRAA